MAQWWRVCLPMQETWVQSLTREGPTCHGATGPLHTTTEPVFWSLEATTSEPLCTLEPVFCNKGSHHNEKPTLCI